MKHVKLDSSVIDSVKYRRKTENLNVTFNGGRTYRYFDVPLDVYEDFLESDSHGAFLNERIKPNYDYEEI